MKGAEKLKKIKNLCTTSFCDTTFFCDPTTQQSSGCTLKEPNNNSVQIQYRLLLVYTIQGEGGSSYIHTLITLLLVYTNRDCTLIEAHTNMSPLLREYTEGAK